MHPELGSVCQEDGLGVGSFFGACDAASGEIQFRGTAWAQGGCVLPPHGPPSGPALPRTLLRPHGPPSGPDSSLEISYRA